MKVIKKICVYLLVGLITFSSVTLSYEKANSCKAVSLALEIGAAVLLLGGLCYGAYYVSQPENQDGVKQALSDYANTTTEGAKKQYEFNKKLFNDFCTYATSKAGSNAAITSADGKKYTVKDMQKEGFPSFEKWDEEMKKQNKKPVKNFGSIWDKMSFGLDLLEFIRGFYENDNINSGTGSSFPQLYFTGDDGYINRETGEVNISLYGISLNSYAISNEPLDNKYFHNDYMRIYSRNVGSLATDYRAYALLQDTKVKYYNYVKGEDSRKLYSTLVQCGIYVGTGTSVLSPSSYYSNVQYEDGAYKFYEGSASNMIVYSSYSCIADYTNPYFVSTNVPLFATREEGLNYIKTGDASTALNLPPTVTVVPTSAPSERPVTPVSIYVNNFKGKNVTVNDITNVNYYIVNNWDTTTNQTQNLTTVINNYYYGTLGNAEGVTDTPVPTATPVPTLMNEDGGNTTNNYIINITNILQPIQETVTNIYNFFVIDTDTISEEMQNINVAPVTKFEKIVTRVSNLKSAFSDDVQDDSVQAGVSGTSYGIYYPVIKMKCPSALLDYVDADSLLDVEGKKYIVLIDFADWAVYFVRVRTFMKVALWIGMFFYLLKQIRVTITIS